MKNSEIFGNRYFYLAFTAAFVILSMLFLLMSTLVVPDSKPSATTADLAQEQGEEPFVPQKDQVITVLFMGSQTGNASAGCFILAQFDPVSGSVPVVAFPAQTMVQRGDTTETIAEAYEYGGAAAAKTALENTLGIPIHRYVHMNTDIFIVCANTIGTVEYNLPMSLPMEQSGVNVILQEGKQLLDGKKAADIISYRGYEEGELARCRMVGELTAAIVNQRIDIAESALLDKIFQKIINLIDTDISYPDYDNRKDAAVFMARMAKDPAYNLEVSGSFHGDETQFELSDTFIARLRQTLSS